MLPTRPNHLPEFETPPLDEVVVGVQFSPSANYSSVRANDIWKLFKDDFPIVQEQPPLEPAFETFGGANQQSGVQFRIGPAPLRSRLWFVSTEKNHLIQFQEDRLLMNWRKRPNGQDYPRFEGIAAAYEMHLGALKSLFETALSSGLDVNQCEVSYINIVNVDDYSKVGEWFNFLCFQNLGFENLKLFFNEVVLNEAGKPFARLSYELQSVVTADGKVKAFRFSLTFRGQPFDSSISAAMKFIRTGREKIVMRFSELTSEKAHRAWKRRK